MDQLMSQQESYADRRKLFKNIWDTSIHIDEKDDLLSKPKVIKTLRLDEMDRCVAGKRKRQRIKNLRTVCNKLLDFCDRQDADDLYYEQMVVLGKEPPSNTIQQKTIQKRILKVRKKIKNAKSMLPAKNGIVARATNSEPVEDFQKTSPKTISRNTSPIKVKRNHTISFATKSNLKSVNEKVSHNLKKKVVRKSHSRRKPSDSLNIPTGNKKLLIHDDTPKKGFAFFTSNKKLIQIHKVNIR